MILFLKILQYTWDPFRFIIKKSSDGPTRFLGSYRESYRILQDPLGSWEDHAGSYRILPGTYRILDMILQDPRQDPTGS